MYLVIDPSDIYYLTGVRPHDPGEILLLVFPDSEKRKNCIFCDPRTAGLFDTERFEIIAERKQW